MSRGRREFSWTLLAAAAGSVLILVALRRPWAVVTFRPPRPLPVQVVSVSGQDLVPAAAALGLAALACLAAVIATRGVGRRVCGVVLGVFGACAGIAAAATVSVGSAISVAAGQVGAPESAALSGGAGSTTSGSSSGGTVVMTTGTAAHAALSATGWRLAVLAGALLVLAAGLAVAWRGPTWPVMSGRYELSSRRDDSGAPSSAGPEASDPRPEPSGSRPEPSGSRPEPSGPRPEPSGSRPEPSGPRPADSASMWESLSRGADPTDEPARSS
jgi:uncharacterized membrane protein (TIGR02234 family)